MGQVLHTEQTLFVVLVHDRDSQLPTGQDGLHAVQTRFVVGVHGTDS